MKKIDNIFPHKTTKKIYNPTIRTANTALWVFFLIFLRLLKKLKEIFGHSCGFGVRMSGGVSVLSRYHRADLELYWGNRNKWEFQHRYTGWGRKTYPISNPLFSEDGAGRVVG